MKVNYLPFSKASELAAAHQRLSGQPLQPGCLIDHVIVAPHSRIIQWAFAVELMRGTRPDARNYAVDERYNVIIVSACEDQPAGFIIKDLREYLQETAMRPAGGPAAGAE